MKLLRDKRSAVLLLVGLTTMIGGVFAGVDEPVECPSFLGDDLFCAAVCNVDQKDTKCADTRDGRYCVCTGKIGGNEIDNGQSKTSSTCDKVDDTCKGCNEDAKEGDPKLEQYECKVTVNNYKIMQSSTLTMCACKVKPASGADEQNKGRGQGKFPPILAQLLKALQQVRNRFSRGRQ